jgi:hypothetical protein
MRSATWESVPSSDPVTLAPRRVLALHEPGRRGSAAVDLARDLVGHDPWALTVICVAPQDTAARCGRCCGSDPRAFNRAVAEATAEELHEARSRLGQIAESVTFTMLVEGVDPPLADWVAAKKFELVLLPARRRLFSGAGHPEAEPLRAKTSAEVRVVDGKSSYASSTEARSHPLPASA